VCALIAAACGGDGSSDPDAAPPPPDAPAGITAALSIALDGVGRVVSSPAGIDCGDICEARFPVGSTVTLRATAVPGTTFTGWQGQCAGSVADCTLVLAADTVVTAPFRGGGLVAATRFGGANEELVRGLFAFADGGMVLGGTFQGTTTLGGAEIASLGNRDALVARLAPDGQVAWQRRIGSGSDEAILSIEVDAAGDVYATGIFGDAIDTGCAGGPIIPQTNQNAFLVKLAGDSGDCVWDRHLASDNAVAADDILLDGDGNVYLVGVFGGTVSLGGPKGIHSTAGQGDVFVAKYSADGAPIWSARHGGGGQDVARRIALAPDGTVVVAGEFGGTASFGTGDLGSAGSQDAFVARFSPGGAPTWSARIGGGGFDIADGVAIGADGALFIAGRFSQTVDFGGGLMLSAVSEATDGFLLRLTPEGAPSWVRALAGAGEDAAQTVAVGGDGDPVVSGFMIGPGDLGAGTVGVAGSHDAFIAKYADADGAHRWSTTLGGPETDAGEVVSLGATAVVAAGQFRGAATIAGAPLESAGDSDIYVVTLGP
jgi:hypothetical protein